MARKQAALKKTAFTEGLEAAGIDTGEKAAEAAVHFDRRALHASRMVLSSKQRRHCERPPTFRLSRLRALHAPRPEVGRCLPLLALSEARAGCSGEVAAMRHTPGPWEADPRGGGVVRSANPATEFQYARGRGRPQVALAVGMVHRPDGEQQANVTLIAAAPELLAALEEEVDMFDRLAADADVVVRGIMRSVHGPRLDRARAVIAKARGETP